LLAATAVALAVVAVVVAVLGPPWSDRSAANGPLVAPSIRQGSGFPRDAGDPVGFAGIRFYNSGPEPAVLDRVTLVDPEAGIRMVGALAAQEPQGGSAEAYPGFPPRREDFPAEVVSFPDLAPLEGYVVPPQPDVNPDAAKRTQLYIGLESTKPDGRVTLQSFRVHYRVDDDRYELLVPYAVAICTPKAEWAGIRPCGGVDGPFLPGED